MCFDPALDQPLRIEFAKTNTKMGKTSHKNGNNSCVNSQVEAPTPCMKPSCIFLKYLQPFHRRIDFDFKLICLVWAFLFTVVDLTGLSFFASEPMWHHARYFINILNCLSCNSYIGIRNAHTSGESIGLNFQKLWGWGWVFI